MRDLAEKWTVVPDWREAVIDAPGLSVRSLCDLHQCLVSGRLDAWARETGLPGQGVGAFGTAVGDRYSVQVARDRVLAVSDSPLALAPGWHAAGFAVTGVSAGLHVFEARGAGIAGLVARATTVDPGAGSASASLTFAGIDAVAYHHGESLRLHVDRGLAASVWLWMQKAAVAMATFR